MESPTSMTSTAETTKNTPIHFVLNVQPTLKFWRLSEGCFKEFQGYTLPQTPHRAGALCTGYALFYSA